MGNSNDMDFLKGKTVLNVIGNDKDMTLVFSDGTCVTFSVKIVERLWGSGAHLHVKVSQ